MPKPDCITDAIDYMDPDLRLLSDLASQQCDTPGECMDTLPACLSCRARALLKPTSDKWEAKTKELMETRNELHKLKQALKVGPLEFEEFLMGHARACGWFTKGDVLELIGEITEYIESTELAMGKGSEADVKANDIFRRGKLEAYKFIHQKIVGQVQWKGMKLP